MHVHYHRTGKVEKDKIQIGLRFFEEAPMCKPCTDGHQRRVPGGAGRRGQFPGQGQHRAAQDCTLYTVTPHMHLIGKKIKITMTPPGGTPSTLVGIDDWDFNWQEIYFLKEPLKVKANTRFDVESVYDNSARNPHNPFSPPAPHQRGRVDEQRNVLRLSGGHH